MEDALNILQLLLVLTKELNTSRKTAKIKLCLLLIRLLHHARISKNGGEGAGSTKEGGPPLEKSNFLNLHNKITENMPLTPLHPRKT